MPELGDEEEQEVIGIHEAIIPKELFDKVQMVLARILEKNASRVEKINYRNELPLRGLLQCPKCHSSWTGSGSKGNGGTYSRKLIFVDGKYRTTGLNEAIALIGLFQKDLGNKKAERLTISDKTFGNVPIPRRL